jgi:hypothetical protein
MNKMTKSQQTNADITALLRARNTLLWVVSSEEVRVERAVAEAAGAASYETVFWDCDTGFTGATGTAIDPAQDPSAALQFIRNRKDRRCVFVLRDLPRWLADPSLLRRLRSLERELQSTPRDQARAIVVLTPSSEIPPELSDCAIVIDYPLPEREEIAAILDDATGALPEGLRATAAPNGVREAAIDAAIGLSAKGAANCYARSLVTTKRIDPALVAADKKLVIAREKVLTWYDPDPRGLDAVGGLDLLKPWLIQRKLAFSQRARDYGLPAPKGVLLVGQPGCGKSLTAKCAATAYGVPLLRIDFGALRSKFVGDSEANARKAYRLAEMIAPCVLWADEIDKTFAGSDGPQGDGGVSADALGSFLTWMQEQKGVFVIATANEVQNMPDALLRKGRFDELFFVDVPTSGERREIIRATLRQFKRDPETVDVDDIVRVTEGFTGSEIAAVVPEALFISFADGARELDTVDLRFAAQSFVPLSKTAAKKFDALRQWAKSNARPASAPEVASANGSRALDL